MKLPNFLKNFNKPKDKPESAAITWDQTKDVPFAGESTPDAATERQKRLQRQGDNLILMYYQGPEAVHGSASVSPAMREDFYDRVVSPEFTSADESRLLRNIVPPFGTPNRPNYQAVFDNIDDKYGQAILSQMAGVSEAELSPAVLANFLQSAPTPVEFDTKVPEFMEDLMQQNLGYEITKYEDRLESFQQQVYGKRYEYYEALKALKQKGYERGRARSSVESALAQQQRYEQLSQPVEPERLQQAWSDPSYVPPEARGAIPPEQRQ